MDSYDLFYNVYNYYNWTIFVSEGMAAETQQRIPIKLLQELSVTQREFSRAA